MRNTQDMLADLLQNYSMTLAELARESGISYNTLSSAKKRNSDLSFDTISRICQTLNIPIYEFFMADEDWDQIGSYYCFRESRIRAAM